MGRRVALVGCVAVLLLGCKGSGQSTEPVDPFFGRVRIDPPRTGAIGSSATDSYAPALRPNPLRGSTGTPSSNPAPGSRPLSGGGGWVPAAANANAGLAGGVPSAASGVSGAADGAFTKDIRPPDRSLALGENPSSGPARSEYKGSLAQPLEGALASGDRIVIPPAAREMAGPSPSGAFGYAQPTTSPPIMQRAGIPQEMRPASSFSRATATSAGLPTTSRPTIDLATERERIIRTLNPAGGQGAPQLPRPVEDVVASPSSAASASPGAQTQSSTLASGPTNASLLPAAPGAPTAAAGTRFPKRVVDITELPAAPTSR